VRDKQIKGLQEELDNASRARSRDVDAAMGDADGWRKKAQEYETRLNDALRQLRLNYASVFWRSGANLHPWLFSLQDGEGTSECESSLNEAHRRSRRVQI